MLWNELDYEIQVKVLEKISALVARESNRKMRQGLAAALNELDMWCNGPVAPVEKPESVPPPMPETLDFPVPLQIQKPESVPPPKLDMRTNNDCISSVVQAYSESDLDR